MPSVVNYTPPPTIRRFMLSNAPVRILMGPVGSGKSSGNCIEIVRRAGEQEADKNGRRRTRGLVVRNTYKQLKRTTIKTFRDWFPAGEAGIWRESDLTFLLRLGDVECEVLFMALDTQEDVANLLSLEATFMYINECREIRPDVMKDIIATKRIGRFPSMKDGTGATWSGIFGDTNPPTEGTYWHYMLEGLNPDSDMHEPMPNSWEVFKQPSGRSPEAENVENLKPGYYDTTDMSDEKIRVYIDGEYGLSKGGRPVWPMFARNLNVAPTKLNPTPYLPVVIGLDPGRTGAAIFMQQNLSGQVLILDELLADGVGAARFITESVMPLINARYEGMKLLVSSDPAGMARSQTEERSVVDVWRAHGFVVKAAYSNNLQPRIEAVDHFLGRRTQAGEAFLISPHVRHLVAAMSGGYKYKLRKDGATDKSDEPVKDSHSHPSDATQYGCMRFIKGGLDAAALLRPPTPPRTRPLILHRPADMRTGY